MPPRRKFFAFSVLRYSSLGSCYRNHADSCSHLGNTHLTEIYRQLKLVSGLHKVGALIKIRFLPVQGVCLANLDPAGGSPQIVRSANPRNPKADRVQEQTSKSNTAQRTHPRRHTFQKLTLDRAVTLLTLSADSPCMDCSLPGRIRATETGCQQLAADRKHQSNYSVELVVRLFDDRVGRGPAFEGGHVLL